MNARALAPSARRRGATPGEDGRARTDILPKSVRESAVHEDARSAGVPRREGARAALWGLGAAVALVWAGVGLAGATRALPTARDAPYTAFYLSGRWARLGVVRAAPGHRLTVTVGVANNSGRPRTYRLSPVLDRTPWRAYTITVPAGGTWTGTAGGRLPNGGCLHRLSLTLHQRGSRDPLRPLALWVRPQASAPRRCSGKA